MIRAGWLLLGLSVCSCSEQNTEHSKAANTVALEPKSATREKRVDPALVGTIERLPLIEPEYKDTVRWNLPGAAEASSADALDGFALRSLTQGEQAPKLSFLYRLDLPGNFYTVVVSYQPSENEIKHYLVTYSRHAERIDTCLVAADEIAEGLLSAYSVISGNAIERHDFNYTNEEAPETVKQFVITDKGEIAAK